MYGVSGFGTVVLVMAWAGAVVLRTMPTHRDETAMYGAPGTRLHVWRVSQDGAGFCRSLNQSRDLATISPTESLYNQMIPRAAKTMDKA
jgi:hypothetical protein